MHRSLSRSGAPAHASGGPTVRRPAADAGDRPRPDGEAETADARRGLGRAVAETGRDGVLPSSSEIRESGVTLLLVEQNARAALAIADRAYVLVDGRNRHEGPGGGALARSGGRRALSRRRAEGVGVMNLQFIADGLFMGGMIGLGAIGVTLTYSILRLRQFRPRRIHRLGRLCDAWRSPASSASPSARE